MLLDDPRSGAAPASPARVSSIIRSSRLSDAHHSTRSGDQAQHGRFGDGAPMFGGLVSVEPGEGVVVRQHLEAFGE